MLASIKCAARPNIVIAITCAPGIMHVLHNTFIHVASVLLCLGAAVCCCPEGSCCGRPRGAGLGTVTGPGAGHKGKG